jgi:N-carbamoyl-L-amino-acid hydrolase
VNTDPADTDVVALLAEIEDIGRDPVRGGWSRHVFDDAETALRAWFTGRAGALGLEVTTDRNANLVAWWGERGSDSVLVGSHLDSVPGGGALDGPLGVASALSAVARLMADGHRPSRPIAIGVFAEEEGSRFGIACLGSKLMTGAIAPERVRALTDASGTTFAEAAAAAGIDPAGLGRDDAFLADVGAFVELHVEQGRGLVDLDAPVGLASAILAHGRWRLTITGEGNHAGATAMADRRDPMAAFAEVVLVAQRVAASVDDPGAGVAARATIGRVVPVPGGTNVIASRVDAWLDVRADDDPATAALLARITTEATDAVARHGCLLTVDEESYGGRVTFDPALRDRLGRALGGVPVLPTGAGHDAGVLGSPTLPTGMLFVRNPTGVSHAPDEGASDEDCRAGVDALVRVLRDLTAAES